MTGYGYLMASDSSSHYFIYFKDKTGNSYSTERPWEFLSVKSIDRRNKFGIGFNESDLPVNINYVESIGLIKDIKIINKSKWLNGIEIICNDQKALEIISQFGFVKSQQFLGRLKSRPISKPDPIEEEFYKKSRELSVIKSQEKLPILDKDAYGKSYWQNQLINVPYLHSKGFMGQNMHIAVFDAGFFNAYKVVGMEDLLNDKTVIRDFVDYDNSVWEDDSHGAKVLSFMKTYNPGSYIGTSPFAEYSLFRTEIASQEYPVEEINWVFAAEFADSLGVDMIIASVGYHAFDDTSLNHPFNEMDGKTSIIARAANLAYAKGIAVVSSAGNEGSGKWRRIGTPADAMGTMAIGACDERGFHIKFSSIGPTYDGRVKPDFISPGYKVIVASPNGYYAGNGTSYATPIFAGSFACFMQGFPYARPDSLRKFVRYASTHVNSPDSAYGYGIPDFGLSYCFFSKTGNLDSTDELWIKDYSILFQDLNIYLRSYSKQNIKVTVKGQKKSKYKKVISKTYKVEKGEWLSSDILFKLLIDEKNRKKRKYLKKITVVIETEQSTFQRNFEFN